MSEIAGRITVYGLLIFIYTTRPLILVFLDEHAVKGIIFAVEVITFTTLTHKYHKVKKYVRVEL